MKLSSIILLITFSYLVVTQYVELPPEVYLKDQIIEDSLNFGGNYIISSAITRDVLPEGLYEITQVTKVEEQSLRGGVDHRFHVEILSTNGVNVTGRYTVFYRYSNQTFRVVSQNYKYRYPSSLNNLENEEYIWEDYQFEQIEEEELSQEEEKEETEPPQEEEQNGEGELPGEEDGLGGEEEYPGEEESLGEEGSGEGENLSEEEYPAEEENLQPSEEEEENPPPEEEEEQPQLPVGYVDLPPEAYLQNQVIEDSLNYGGNFIVRQAVDRNAYPSGDFSIAKLTKVEEQRLRTGVDYRFHVRIVSAQGVSITGRFTVYYQYSDQSFKVVSRNYNYKYPTRLQDSEYTWSNYQFNS